MIIPKIICYIDKYIFNKLTFTVSWVCEIAIIKKTWLSIICYETLQYINNMFFSSSLSLNPTQLLMLTVCLQMFNRKKPCEEMKGFCQRERF